MTLTDIIIRDLVANMRKTKAREAMRGYAKYEREISRRLWRRRLKKFRDIAVAIVMAAMLALLVTLYLALTPSQRSAEADIVAVQMEAR